MNYIKQLGVLLACCVAGDALSILLRGALPSNVLGLTLLLLLLIFGPIRLHHVEHTADFLLQNMAFFFIPAGVSIINYFGILKHSAVQIVIICIISTIITFTVTAYSVMLTVRWMNRRKQHE